MHFQMALLEGYVNIYDKKKEGDLKHCGSLSRN